MERMLAFPALVVAALALAACASSERPRGRAGDVEARVTRCNRLAREVRTWCRTPTGEYRTNSRRECLEARVRLDQYCF